MRWEMAEAEGEVHAFPLGEGHELATNCWCVPIVEVWERAELVVHRDEDDRLAPVPGLI